MKQPCIIEYTESLFRGGKHGQYAYVYLPTEILKIKSHLRIGDYELSPTWGNRYLTGHDGKERGKEGYRALYYWLEGTEEARDEFTDKVTRTLEEYKGEIDSLPKLRQATVEIHL